MKVAVVTGICSFFLISFLFSFDNSWPLGIESPTDLRRFVGGSCVADSLHKSACCAAEDSDSDADSSVDMVTGLFMEHHAPKELSFPAELRDVSDQLLIMYGNAARLWLCLKHTPEEKEFLVTETLRLGGGFPVISCISYDDICCEEQCPPHRRIRRWIFCISILALTYQPQSWEFQRYMRLMRYEVRAEYKQGTIVHDICTFLSDRIGMLLGLSKIFDKEEKA